MNGSRRDDSRPRISAIAAGMRWASTITSIGLEMALPALGGAWLDQRYGTSPVFVIILAAAGFLVAMYHLWQLVNRMDSRKKQADRRSSRR